MVLVPRNTNEARSLEDRGFTRTPGSGYDYDYQPPLSNPQPTIPGDTAPTVTGAAPEQFAGMLYDKDIPVVLAGLAVIGGRIIEGPIYGTVDGQHVASWISGYAINANYAAANIEVRELRFRGKRAWTLSGGATMPGLTIGATVGSAQTARFSGLGNLTQSPDAWSTTRFGARAVAYRPMITATFQNIKVAQFNNFLPFTSIVIADDTYCTPGDLLPYADALPALARFAGFEDDEFEATGMTGGRQAYFFAKKQTLLQYLNERRILKKYWSIRQKDKLYVVEHATTDIDVTVDRSKVAKSGDTPFVFTQAAAITMPRKLTLTYVDADRDYDLNTVYAELEVAPIPATTAFEEESVEIADVTTADEATAEVNYALYNADAARERGETTGKRVLYTLEVGDQVKYETEFRDYYHRIDEVVRGVGCTIDIRSEGMITCGIDSEHVGDGVGGVFVSGDACGSARYVSIETPTVDQDWVGIGDFDFVGGSIVASSYAKIADVPTILLGGKRTTGGVGAVIMKSNDGLSWSTVFTIGIVTDRVKNLYWNVSEGRFLAEVTVGGVDRCWVSYNGSDWDEIVADFWDHVPPKGNDEQYGDGIVGYDPENDLWIYPEDLEIDFMDAISCTAFVNGIWMAGGHADFSSVTGTSIDGGETWTLATSGAIGDSTDCDIETMIAVPLEDLEG